MKLSHATIKPRSKQRLFVSTVSALFIVSLGINLLSQTNDVAAIANWQPGRIMDDVVMINSSSMSAAQIQAFLNAKEPTCDTSGAQQSEMNNSGVPDYNGNGSIQRWEWGKSHYNQTTFPCLKNYTQNGASAAQIIYNASHKYTINPQVLLVLLQKEQGLVTDTWPLNIQYQSATGYGCPDTAPCNTQYYGLTNQINWSAKMFRAIENNSSSWYTPYIMGSNFIRYSPISSCGGTTVNIQNRATQALYNYTPYQPNQAALNAGYGSGNSCSSYGNRNFYLYFTNWFGSTYTSVRYAWRPVSQTSYADSAHAAPLDGGAIVAPGQTIYLEVKIQNMGYQTWDTTTHLGTAHARDRASTFANSSWLNPARLGMTETSVPPAGIGTFTFSVTAPQSPGRYKEYFGPLAEGVTWMNDLGMYYTIDVTPRAPTPSAETQLSAGQQINVGNYIMSADKHSVLMLQGDGNTVLYSDFRPRWSSNTSGTRNAATLVMQGDGNLVEYTSSGRPIWESRTSGNVGAYTRLQTDGNLVVYSSDNTILWSSNTISHPDYLGRVVDVLPTSTLYSGQSLETVDRSHALVLQGDGNLVLYSSNTPVWASGTNGKSVARLVMQGDGNLVLYGTNNRPVWSTKTSKKGASWLVLQGDGNLVLYNRYNRATWSTKTYGK